VAFITVQFYTVTPYEKVGDFFSVSAMFQFSKKTLSVSIVLHA
jgi:hypothetical protein